MPTPTNYDAYLPGIKKRWQAKQTSWEVRRLQAHQVACKIATMLYSEYSANQVVLFGSTIKLGEFDQYSDIDLAVSGIASDRFFRAVAHALSLGETFKVDLVDLADCPSAIRESILQTGEHLSK